MTSERFIERKFTLNIYLVDTLLDVFRLRVEQKNWFPQIWGVKNLKTFGILWLRYMLTLWKGTSRSYPTRQIKDRLFEKQIYLGNSNKYAQPLNWKLQITWVNLMNHIIITRARNIYPKDRSRNDLV